LPKWQDGGSPSIHRLKKSLHVPAVSGVTRGPTRLAAVTALITVREKSGGPQGTGLSQVVHMYWVFKPASATK